MARSTGREGTIEGLTVNGAGENFVFVRMADGELVKHAVSAEEWRRLEHGQRYTFPVETR